MSEPRTHPEPGDGRTFPTFLATGEFPAGLGPTVDGFAARDTPPPDPSAAPSYRLEGFEIERVIGRGGMGIVYLARQLRPSRPVAIKVLPPAFVDDPLRLARFHTEAEAAAKLTDSCVLPIYEFRESDGIPMIVMPYVDGTDLERIIVDRKAARSGEAGREFHPWAYLPDQAYLARILPVLDQAVKAITAIHRAGVLHRDVKPSNILVDHERGNVWLTDFGLARLSLEASATLPGSRVGSAGYMSPEQWEAAGRVDERSDVFSLAATIYRAVALALPYGTISISRHAAPPSPLTKRQPLVSRDLDAVVRRALEPEPSDRYATAEDFQSCWMAARAGLVPPLDVVSLARRVERFVRRNRPAIVSGTLFVGVALYAALQIYRDMLEPKVIPPTDLRKVTVETKPEGARVILVPLDAQTGLPEPTRAVRPEHNAVTPVTVEVPPGDYLVEAAVPGLGFQQAYRHVPRPQELARGIYLHHFWKEGPGGTIVLPAIAIRAVEPPPGMALVPGDGQFYPNRRKNNPNTPNTPLRRGVRAFYIDTREVTAKEFFAIFKRPIEPVRNHRAPDDHPVVGLSHGYAMHYAEFVGKRLMTDVEYAYVATDRDRSDYPWGDAPPAWKDDWRLGPAGAPKEDAFRGTADGTPVFGLYSNAGEMTSTWLTALPGVEPTDAHRNLRVARGAPAQVLTEGRGQENVNGTENRTGVDLHDTERLGLGFRCARSVGPEYLDDTWAPPPPR